MRDWFATLRKPRATGATGATTGLTVCDTSLSLSPDDVAQLGNHRATGATSSSADKASALPVAQVAHGLPSASGGRPTAKAEQNCGFLGPVAQVAQVAHENRAGPREAPSDEWGAEDWLAFFAERAGIGEHDAGLRRADAEAQAYERCIVKWMNCNPPTQGDIDLCIHCEKRMPEREVIPILTGAGGHVWLHDRCHAQWMAKRRTEAVAALATLGLEPKLEHCLALPNWPADRTILQSSNAYRRWAGFDE